MSYYHSRQKTGINRIYIFNEKNHRQTHFFSYSNKRNHLPIINRKRKNSPEIRFREDQPENTDKTYL
uniref:Uncharacterized protein MANES_12G110600 n=1 Tax=Rhizophora mucronata TaxID=61149 RepID=A0A2P2J6W0_RHIMU